jgi:MYXO-CTERM domain-containing protein
MGWGGCAVPPFDPNNPDAEPEPCVSEAYFMCVPPPPPPCSTNADCTGNQICLTYQYETCDGGSAPGGSSSGSNPAPEPTNCTTQNESYCVPRYFAPCEAASDCGAGFDCVQESYTTCSGGGFRPDDGSGSSSSGMGPAPDEDACETTLLDSKYCQLQEIDCLDSQTCPEGLTCESYESGGSSSGSCTTDPNGNTSCDTSDPTPPEAIARCVPEDWSYWFGGPTTGSPEGATSGGGKVYDDLVGGSTGRDGLSSNDGASSSGGATSGGTSGGATSGGTSGATGGNADGGGDGGGGGCQVVGTQHSDQTPWSALALGLGLLIARRVRRRSA